MNNDYSPRSSTTSFRTTSTVESHELRTRPEHAKRTPTSYFPHDPSNERHFNPSHERNNNESIPTRDRKQSIPYAELERREREEEERNSQFSKDSDGEPKRLSDIRSEGHMNAHSECGRHGDDWLFGGMSVGDGVKWLLGKK
ncbi:uncharacterized protein PAC_00287 [Phialocephala subalpina]|uniref:Uncharacterized protein n=1 Tax=Phialocephala subalpina TaxID=576137 RepID=A0A1L7WCB4_9HELO|nr:uncharacterized protein PAC_00287 [Phialocephala subalpina]